MDINEIKTFLAVANTRHFGKAAKQLYVTQSTVSARIKSLEESLDVELFVRERANIHLTSEGEALIPHANSIVALWSRARHDLGVSRVGQNHLVIGGQPGIWDIILHDWLAKILREWPDLSIRSDVVARDVQVEQVLNGSMDLGFLYDAPRGLGLVAHPLKPFELRLVSNTKFPSAQLALEDSFIQVDWGQNFTVQFATAFPEMSKPRVQTSLGRIAFEYIKTHRGCAYLPVPLIDALVHAGKLFYIADAPVFERVAYAIYREDNEKKALIGQLIENLFD